MMNGYFITGTDTEIGKTYVLSQLFAWLKGGGRLSVIAKQVVLKQSSDMKASADVTAPYLALKPVASGFEDLMAIQSLQPDVQAPICGWSYAEPIAPHFAAARQGHRLSANEIADWCLNRVGQQSVLVEGAGGLLMPLNESESWVDVIQQLQIPVILVVGLRLGCMNHALLTDRVMQMAGIMATGWIANHLSADLTCANEMVETLRAKMQAPYLGSVAYQGGFNPASVHHSLHAE